MLTALIHDGPNDGALLRPGPIAPCADRVTPSMPDDAVDGTARMVAVRDTRAAPLREECERMMALGSAPPIGPPFIDEAS